MLRTRENGWWALLLIAAACGGPQPLGDLEFHAILREEATIDRHEGALESPECGERSEAADAICGASERLCAISGAGDDPDANTRCAASERRCAHARAIKSGCRSPE